MRLAALIIFIFSNLISTSQLVGVTVEPFAVHQGIVGDTDLTGYITWRIYVEFGDEGDYLQTVFADLESDSLVFNSTLPFFQSQQGGFFEYELPCILFETFPASEFDSFITLGRSSDCDPGGPTQNFIGQPQFSQVNAQFEAGEDFTVNDGEWGFPLEVNEAGFAGSDFKVLIAQLTTQGNLNLRLNLKYIPNGGTISSTTGIIVESGVIGCTNPLAFNYNAMAEIDDGSCEYLVTFNVEFQEQLTTGSVRLRGSWDNYCTECANLDDENEDNIWTGTALIPEGEYGYFYTSDFINSENLYGLPCSNLYNGIFSRTIEVPATLETEILCFNDCEACEIMGCSDPDANNFNPLATSQDDLLCSYGPLVEVIHEVYYEDDDSVDEYPEGAKTYRIYALLEDDIDFISSVYGVSNHFLALGTTTGQIWNSSLGAISGDDLNSILFSSFPALEYDSFITIGRANSDDPGSSISEIALDPNPEVFIDSFSGGVEDTINPNLIVNDGIWFSAIVDVNGLGTGPDNRVLLAQITSTEDLYYKLNLQIFNDGDGLNDTQLYFHDFAEQTNEFSGDIYGLSYPLGYCSDPVGCNYIEQPPAGAEWSPDFCEYLSCAGCMDEEAANYLAEATQDDGSCIYGCDSSILLFEQIGLGGNGWYGATYSIYEYPGNLIATGSPSNLVSDIDTICVTSSCFYLTVGGGSADEFVAWQIHNGYNNFLLNGFSTEGMLLQFGEEECSVPGCMNPLADNFDPEAEWDVGTCLLGGCIDPEATNFDPDATYDDGSCVFPCIPQTLVLEFLCQWSEIEETLNHGISLHAVWNGDCLPDSLKFIVVGQPNLTYTYSWQDLFSGEYNSGDLIDVDLPAEVLPDTYAVHLVFEENVFIEDILVIPFCLAGCTDPVASNYEPLATVDDFSCLYESCPETLFLIHVETASFGGEVSWTLSNNENETLLSGGDYSSYEEYTDSVCLESGCYTLRLFDDFGDGWNGGSYEYFLDGLFGGTGTMSTGTEVLDLIPVLQGCPVDGCTDPDAINYDAMATVPDGSCVYDADSPEGQDNENENIDIIIPPGNIIGDIYNVEFQNLNLQNSLSVQVFNSIGKLCFSASYIPLNTRSDLQIDLAFATSGIYYLRVINGNNSDAIQFVHFNGE